ncbi:MAG: dimethyl sulfoxide reductase anchor subunit family protein [Marivivens sp.]|jgi:DMSO reductase anchor subunit|nr:dibenzothiophene desulfurase [Paracoccaceae bacterium]
MHPAKSVIIFTTLSGIGFGMLFFIGLGMIVPEGLMAFIWFAIAYLFAVGGLIASTFHLKHPERALRAFTQWKTSWLSREGVLSVVALLVMAVYGAGLVFLGTRFTYLGYAGAILSVLSVFATSMIYAQLKTVPRWRDFSTPLMFLGYAGAGGSLMTGQVDYALALLALAGLLQLLNWMRGDGALGKSGSDIGTATGLGTAAQVRAFEPPHTGTNYLLKEMVYVVGRKHAGRLRILSLLMGIGLPILLLLAPFGHMLAALAIVSHIVGVFASRWLFFAQAEHVVGLYYGKR